MARCAFCDAEGHACQAPMFGGPGGVRFLVPLQVAAPLALSIVGPGPLGAPQPTFVPGGSMKAEKRLYYTADRSQLVDDSSPDGASLAYAEGDDIPAAEAQRFGLSAEKPKAATRAEPAGSDPREAPKLEPRALPDEDEDEPETGRKAAESPVETKEVERAESGTENKARGGRR